MVATSSLPPRVGLGMAALGRPGYINLDRNAVLPSRTIEGMQERSNVVMEQVLKESTRLGILPWFDCARSYGLSEKFVGEFLRAKKLQPNEVYVSSKWGYTYVADWNIELEDGEPHEVKDHSVENFLKQVKETADNVGEYLNLYQVHSATFDSGILTNESVHKALDQCREERGWSIGLSVSGPSQDDILREAMKINVSGSRLFDSVQCTFNILEQKPGAALLEAHNAGLDIIIKEGLANGRALRHPKLVELSNKNDKAPDQLALGCILAQPFAPRVLSGAVTADQLESNFHATEIVAALKNENEGLLREIMDECAVVSEEYWKDRSALKWN